MQRVHTLILLLFILPVLSAASASWGDSVSGDLHWGENLSLDGYRLVLADFSKESANPAVLLKLYKGSSLLMQQPLYQGQNFTLNDTISAEVESITMPYHSEGYDEPSAKISLKLYAYPDIKLHLISEKETYEPGEEIHLSLLAENQGTEDAENIRINLSSQPELFHFSDGISILNAGNSTYFGDGDVQKWICLKAPFLRGYSTFYVRAIAKYSGKDEKEHQSKVYCTFGIEGLLSLHKSTEENMVPGKQYPVILSLRNLGIDIITIDLTDTITEEFQTDSNLKWNIELEPEQTTTISYMIKPKRPGTGFVLPSATADYILGKERYETRSEAPSVDVFGPSVDVNKHISSSLLKPGEIFGVSIEVVNKGNRTVRAQINESIPYWARFDGGKTRLNKILSPGEKTSISYRLSCNQPGSHELPGTTVFYTDARGDQYNASSSSQIIIIQEKETPVNITIGKTDPVKDNDSATNGSFPRPNGDSKAFSSLFSFLILSAASLALIYFLIERIL